MIGERRKERKRRKGVVHGGTSDHRYSHQMANSLIRYVLRYVTWTCKLMLCMSSRKECCVITAQSEWIGTVYAIQLSTKDLLGLWSFLASGLVPPFLLASWEESAEGFMGIYRALLTIVTNNVMPESEDAQSKALWSCTINQWVLTKMAITECCWLGTW